MSAQPQHRMYKIETIVFIALGLILLVSIFLPSRTPSSRSTSTPTVLQSSIDTTAFDGRYRLVPEESFPTYRKDQADAEAKLAKQVADGEPHDPKLAAKIENLKSLIRMSTEQFEGFIIRNGVIHSGRLLVQEFSLRRAEIVGDTLSGTASWHEDVFDPGDVQDIELRLVLKGNRLAFSLGAKGEGFGEPVVLERVAHGG